MWKFFIVPFGLLLMLLVPSRLAEAHPYASRSAVSVRSSAVFLPSAVCIHPVSCFIAAPVRFQSVQVQAEAIPAPTVVQEEVQTIQPPPITRTRTILVPQTVTETVQPPPITVRKQTIRQEVFQQEAVFAQQQEFVAFQQASFFVPAAPVVIQKQGLFQRLRSRRGYGGW